MTTPNRSKNHSLTIGEATVECGRLDFADDTWSFDRQPRGLMFWRWSDDAKWKRVRTRDVPEHVLAAVRLLDKYRVTAGKGNYPK